MTMDPATTSLASQHLIEFGFAAALMANLWQRHWGYAAFLALALAESHADLRYPFHVWVRDALLGDPPADAEKHIVQSTLTYVVAMLGLAILLLLIPMLVRASAGRRLMIGGTAIIVAVLALELISQHKMDAVIYHLEGPFARAAIAYFIGAAAITCGALLTSHRERSMGNISAPRGAGRDA
jgi:hypothetical protein